MPHTSLVINCFLGSIFKFSRFSCNAKTWLDISKQDIASLAYPAQALLVIISSRGMFGTIPFISFTLTSIKLKHDLPRVLESTSITHTQNYWPIFGNDDTMTSFPILGTLFSSAEVAQILYRDPRGLLTKSAKFCCV